MRVDQGPVAVSDCALTAPCGRNCALWWGWAGRGLGWGGGAPAPVSGSAPLGVCRCLLAWKVGRRLWEPFAATAAALTHVVSARPGGGGLRAFPSALRLASVVLPAEGDRGGCSANGGRAGGAGARRADRCLGSGVRGGRHVHGLVRGSAAARAEDLIGPAAALALSTQKPRSRDGGSGAFVRVRSV